MPHAKFRTSEQTDKIDAALAKAQAKIRSAEKDAANPHFKTKFASLNSIVAACKDALSEAGVARVQIPFSEGDLVGVTTRLSCGGQFYEGDLLSKPAQAGPQALGSVVSYLKRYGLAAMCGVAVGDDDDAEAAEDREKPEKPNGRASQDAAAKVREAMKTPAFRKQEAIKALDSMGLDVRAELRSLLGRIFPAGQDIRLQNEDELAKLEAHVTLRKAEHNQGQAAH